MTRPLDEEWGTAASGEFVKPQELEGNLLIVYPTGYVPFIQTVHTRPDKPSDAIRVDVVNLDQIDEATGTPGKVYRNSNWMQSVLIASLRPEIGRKVLGVMGKGVGKKGFNAPWVLTDMSGDEKARQRASEWLAAHPNFTPSTFLDPAVDPMSKGYTPTPQAQYAQPAATSTPAAPAREPEYVPVPGSQYQVTDEEASLLAQLRAQRKEREAQANPNAEPPF